MSASRVMIALPEHSASPDELLGLRVEVLRSVRRTAALHIVGSAPQVRVPEHLADERVAPRGISIRAFKARWGS